MTRILVIDDNDQFREMLRGYLMGEGYEVIVASDGREGCELYREDPTDLIITDVLMPEKDGVETIVDLKKDYPNAKIIIISGGGQMASGEDYLKSIGLVCDVEHSFSKPFAMEDMLKVIKEIVG